jgi:hypothetical protein
MELIRAWRSGEDREAMGFSGPPPLGELGRTGTVDCAFGAGTEAPPAAFAALSFVFALML